MLALLLMERGRVVSVDRLIDQLWRGEPPPRAIAVAAGVRVQPAPPAGTRAATRRRRPSILVSVPPGYALRLPGDAVDAWRFESLLTAAHEAAAPDDPDQARRDLDAGAGTRGAARLRRVRR